MPRLNMSDLQIVSDIKQNTAMRKSVLRNCMQRNWITRQDFEYLKKIMDQLESIFRGVQSNSTDEDVFLEAYSRYKNLIKCCDIDSLTHRDIYEFLERVWGPRGENVDVILSKLDAHLEELSIPERSTISDIGDAADLICRCTGEVLEQRRGAER